ncbi:hypothetical protein [Sphingobium yanoikuyae]
MPIDDGVYVAEVRLTYNVFGGDAVNSGVEVGEFITRIDQRLVLEHLNTILETDDPDLADSAHARACCFDIHDHKIGDYGFWESRLRHRSQSITGATGAVIKLPDNERGGAID